MGDVSDPSDAYDADCMVIVQVCVVCSVGDIRHPIPHRPLSPQPPPQPRDPKNSIRFGVSEVASSSIDRAPEGSKIVIIVVDLDLCLAFLVQVSIT